MAMKQFESCMSVNDGDLDDSYRTAHNKLASSMVGSTAPYDGSINLLVKADKDGKPVVQQKSSSGLTDEQVILFADLVKAAEVSVTGSTTKKKVKSQIMVEK